MLGSCDVLQVFDELMHQSILAVLVLQAVIIERSLQIDFELELPRTHSGASIQSVFPSRRGRPNWIFIGLYDISMLVGCQCVFHIEGNLSGSNCTFWMYAFRSLFELGESMPRGDCPRSMLLRFTILGFQLVSGNSFFLIQNQIYSSNFFSYMLNLHNKNQVYDNGVRLQCVPSRLCELPSGITLLWIMNIWLM